MKVEDDWAAARKVSLSHPDVTINLQHNGKSVRQYIAAISEDDTLKRVASVFGQSFLENSIYLEDDHSHSQNGMTLKGWIGLPTYSRSQADQQALHH